MTSAANVRSRMTPALTGFAAGALALSSWIGVRRQRRALAQQVDRLTRAAAAGSRRTRLRSQDDGGLPPPVARYLQWALPEDREIRLVRIGQVGRLRTGVGSDRWMRFEAEHTASPTATGFVWNARVHVAPLLHVRVRDSLVAGEGSGQVSLLSAVTVASAAATPEMNSGALHRYLAEAVWYPTALLPSEKLRWTPIDDHRALATLTERGAAVSLEFRFADSGEVTAIFTPARWGTFDGGYRQLPWEGHFGRYERRDGIMVPMEGNVGWYLDGEWRTVWRGTVTGFDVQVVG